MEVVSHTITEAIDVVATLLNAGRVDEAEALCQKLLERIPNQSDALHIRGLIRVRQGEYQQVEMLHKYREAEDLLRQALTGQPDNPHIRADLSRLSSKLKLTATNRDHTEGSSVAEDIYSIKEAADCAALYFHQGWTDIVNCLALVTYFAERYKSLTLIARADAAPVIEYYTRQFQNVQIDYQAFDVVEANARFNANTLSLAQKHANADLHFLGYYDFIRRDQYRLSFQQRYCNEFFVDKFYICYDIDYMTRVRCFNLPRDEELEDSIYEHFVAKHGEDYVLYHEDVNRNVIISKSNFANSKAYVNLDKMSDIMFDYAKVMARAKEIHMIDSVWAAVAYHLDAKYKLLQNVPVYVHCLRGYRDMFLRPIALPNWRVI